MVISHNKEVFDYANSIIPSITKEMCIRDRDYAGTLFDDGRWIFVLMKRNI